jgi:hypothetical protein
VSVAWFELHFPGDLSEQQAAAFIRSLASRGRAGVVYAVRPVVFEQRFDGNRSHWRIGLPDEEAPQLTRRLEHFLPGIAVITDTHRPITGLAVELHLRSQRRTLRVDVPTEVSRGLLSGLQGLSKSEEVVIQWVVGGWLPRSPVRPASETSPGAWELDQLGRPLLDTESVSEARRKQAEQLFACVGRVTARAATAGRRRHLVSRVAGTYQVLRVSGAGLSRRALPSWWVSVRRERFAVSQIDPPCVLRADELVALLGWPVGVDETNPLPGVTLRAARLLRPDRAVVRHVEVEGQRVIGESTYPSAPGSVVLPTGQALRHLHVLGPTGTGKSTLLARMIIQDITAGYGTVVVDPKGDLVDDVIARLPASAMDSVAVLNPSDPSPIGINPLSGGSVGLAVDGLLGIFHSLWASSWGPRLHDVLHAGLLTLASEPGHSLIELPLLLTDPSFRRPLVAKVTANDPIGMGAFWPWFEALSPESAAQVLGPVMNKLRAFVLRPDLRAVLGQASPRFALRQVFTERRSLLVRLPKGELGAEAAALLGSLVVNQVWQATLARAGIQPERRRPVFVYLDEFQEVVRLPLALGDALAQARSHGVGLVLSHQHLTGQLSPELRAGVLANAGSRVVFRLDQDDAAVMARRSQGRLKAEDFSSLPAFEAYADLMAGNQPTGFASIRTLPLGRRVRSVASARASNRRRYGVDRAQTEARLRGLVGGQPSDLGSFGVLPDNGDET